jgi:hypothetical protein
MQAESGYKPVFFDNTGLYIILERAHLREREFYEHLLGIYVDPTGKYRSTSGRQSQCVNYDPNFD